MNFCVLDLETTGFSPFDDKIIEIALVKIRDGKICDTYTTLLNPEITIPPHITDITGITNEDVAGKPIFKDIQETIQSFVSSDVIIAHNAPFDKSFMDVRLDMANDWMDTVALARIIWPLLPSHSLENLVAHMGIVNEDAHRSLSDTICTAKLFLQLIKEYEALPFELHRNILALAPASFTPLLQYLRQLSARNFKQNIKFGTTVTFAEFHPKAPVISAENTNHRIIDEEFILSNNLIEKYFSEDKMVSCFEGYENRPQQMEMASAVVDAFNNKSILLAEAGTGTGKSLAYLLPAVLFALGSDRVVAISTHTLTLQDQLINKDIPLLKKILGREFKAAVLKGRGNYICLRAFESLIYKAADDDMQFAVRIIVWLSQTTDGDGSILLLTPDERWKWKTISASKDVCIGPKCKHYNSDCFVYNNRRAAALCDIVIINHSLLIADASFEKGFLPDLPYLIIDEAHHLEKVATDQLASKLNYYDIKACCERISGRDRGVASGLLITIEKSTGKLIDTAEDKSSFHERMNALEGALYDLLSQNETFFTSVRDIFMSRISDGYFPAKIRIMDEIKLENFWLGLKQIGAVLGNSFTKLIQTISALNDNLSIIEMQTECTIYGKEEMKMIGLTIREYLAVLEDILEIEEPKLNVVSWVQFPEISKFPELHMAPVELGVPLNSCLFSQKSSIILTSATLTTGTSFSYYKKTVGLDICEKEITELCLPSPFYYNEQARFIVCEDMPDPGKANEQLFIHKTAELLIEMIAAAQGRSLILFTSHAQLKSVYNQIYKPLSARGIQVLGQGMGVGRNTILQRFRREERSCILGSNTFWEGIDVIGETLSMVVIIKLPFWPPVTPTVQAKCEEIEKRGENSFMDYSLPEAIIRFKQGFGRLIRSSEDQGVFVVLDRRIIEKRYGRIFIEALPEMPIYFAPAEEIPIIVANWLD